MINYAGGIKLPSANHGSHFRAVRVDNTSSLRLWPFFPTKSVPSNAFSSSVMMRVAFSKISPIRRSNYISCALRMG